MNSTDLKDLFRETVMDQEEPKLWSDSEVYRYIDDAQKMFCRLTGGLGDATSTLTQIAFTTASDWVTTSALILKIRQASFVSDGRPVELMNAEDMPARRLRFDGRPALPKNLIIGIEAHKARLHPYPDRADTLALIVDRLPLASITDDDQTFEVDEQHHQHLVDWVCHRAYRKQDAETFDRTKSLEYEQSFRAYCAAAKTERERALSKVRVVSYGGL